MNNAKILIIDDNKNLVEIISEMLAQEGYETVTAEDGASGIQKALTERPDLIICDIVMPKMDGYQTFKLIKQKFADQVIPFIFLTAKSNMYDLRTGMDIGADDYLTKPFTKDQLVNAVKARLEKAQKLLEIANSKVESLRTSITRSLPHELLTPLNGIIGLTEILISSMDELQKTETIELLSKLMDSELRLKNTISDYLLYAQLEIASHNSEMAAVYKVEEPVNAKEILESIPKKQALSLEREEDLVLWIESYYFPASEKVIEKIVEELLQNAFKFSKRGNIITVNTYNEDNHFVFSVRNEGKGMTAEQIENVGAYMQFERRFYEQQGSGLGLAIVKKIAEILNGTVDIKSIPGEFMIVTVKIPY